MTITAVIIDRRRKLGDKWYWEDTNEPMTRGWYLYDGFYSSYKNNIPWSMKIVNKRTGNRFMAPLNLELFRTIT